MDFIRELGALVLDHRCRRITETLLRTAEEVYQACGLHFRPRWTSTYQLLVREGPLPVTEIAQSVGLTHPAVIGITDEMREAGVVADVRDREDGRRRLVGLTASGRRLEPALRNVWNQLAATQRERFAAAGFDIIALLDQFEDTLAERNLTAEVLEKLGRSRSSSRRAVRLRSLLAGVALALSPGTATVAQQPPRSSAGIHAEVVRAVSQHLVSGYIYEETGRLMADSLEARLRAGGFDRLSSEALADSVTALLSRLSHDPHLGLHFEPSSPAPAAAPPSDLQQEPAPTPGSPESLGFHRVETLPDSIGYIDLRGFSDAPEALRYADSVMASLAEVKALIIDLRANRGGGPEMVRLLSTYLFDRPTHLVSTFMRGMTAPRERWTVDRVRGPRIPRVPVYLLTSRRTISAAESFAFGLKINRRVTIVGEPTGGGGHFGDFIELPAGFSMFLPRGRTYDPRTNQGWESTGIEPDVVVPAGDALTKALELIRGSGSGPRGDAFGGNDA